MPAASSSGEIDLEDGMSILSVPLSPSFMGMTQLMCYTVGVKQRVIASFYGRQHYCPNTEILYA